jgi:Uncharacterized protein conserved in bacteria
MILESQQPLLASSLYRMRALPLPRARRWPAIVAALILVSVPVSEAQPYPSEGLNVVSLNMAEVTDADRIWNDWRRSSVRRADLLLLQEVVSGSGASAVRELAERLGYQFCFAPAGEPIDGVAKGLAILSRYPLEDIRRIPLKEFDLHFRSRKRIALAATLNTPQGHIRIYNLHLDNRLNARDHLEQLEPVLADARAFSGPQLIGGDFNSAHIYWISHVLPIPFLHEQPQAIQEAMRKEGYTTPFRNAGPTFDHLGLRLDWIYLRGLHAGSWGIEPMAFSDHHAIWLSLRQDPATVRKQS